MSWDSGDAYDVDGGLADRFYVQVDNAADAAELSVGDLTVGGTLALTGKLGFLEVEASGRRRQERVRSKHGVRHRQG